MVLEFIAAVKEVIPVKIIAIDDSYIFKAEAFEKILGEFRLYYKSNIYIYILFQIKFTNYLFSIH